ncbi:MAG TPA: BlaI/MecI/CopY family transcriptional regulator [Terriglobales bacterium]
MTRKRTAKQLTPFELEIMKILWETGPATVQTVRDRLHGKPAYTTVQTMLNVLHRKGKAKRVLKGKSYEYSPSISKEGAVGHAIRDLLDRLFGGSAEDLVMTLVRDRHLTPQKLAELKEHIERSQREEKRDARR